jgi:hypothetical protein
MSRADLCASKLNPNFATSAFPEVIHCAALPSLASSCLLRVCSISVTTLEQFVTMPAICFFRVSGNDSLFGLATSSASNSRTVLSDSSSRETASRSPLAARTSRTNPVTKSDTFVMVPIRERQVVEMDRGSISNHGSDAIEKVVDALSLRGDSRPQLQLKNVAPCRVDCKRRPICTVVRSHIHTSQQTERREARMWNYTLSRVISGNYRGDN